MARVARLLGVQVAIVTAGIGSTVQPSIAEEPRDASGTLQVGCWDGAIWKRSELGLSAVDA
jgi:hypothetical protein